MVVTLSLIGAALSAQSPAQVQQTLQNPPATDIYLARRLPDGGLDFAMNITAREGYDNQPSFTPDGTAILFTRRDAQQTDIYAWEFTSRGSAPRRVTDTPESEYSPTVTPDGKGISVIRVEADGMQRLWRFALDGTAPALVLKDVTPVGYHAWGDAGQLALFVLGSPNSLQLADARTGRSAIVARGIGRSLHRLPGRATFSVVQAEGPALSEPRRGESKGADRWIKELDPKTRTLTPLVRTLDAPDADYTWTPDGAILAATKGDVLMRWKAGGDWTRVADLGAQGLKDVTRLAVSPDGRWLAIVANDQKD